MNHSTNNVLITMSEAIQLLETRAPEVLVLEVVSDYYFTPGLWSDRRANPLPGFAQIKTERLESPPLWNRRADADLQAVLAGYGLAPDTPKQILLFDNIQLACGRAQSRFDASARLLAILHYFGFAQAAIILDPAIRPTFPEALAAEYPAIVRRLASHSAAGQAGPADPPGWVPKNRDHFVDYETLAQLIAGESGPYRLLDARSAEEHAGTFTGYDYIPVAGKIPTSESIVNGDYQVSARESLKDVLARLAAALAGKGIGRKDRIIWYCGTGWRASRMAALTRALGCANVAIYDGGWNEWRQKHPEDGQEKPSGIEPSAASR